MAQTQILKRRVRSVRNAGQITKAMEVVAASRMRRVQEVVQKVQAYADVADAIMRKIAPSQEAKLHPFFNPMTGKSNLYIIFSSDRGLAGAFNSNVFSQAHRSFLADKAKGIQPVIIVFGRKGASHFARIKDATLASEYEDVADNPDVNVFAPVLEAITKGSVSGDFNSVQLIHTHFQSSLLQQVRQEQLLPVVQRENAPEDNSNSSLVTDNTVYEFEPNIEAVLDEALRLYFESRLMLARVESAASEYAMRMVAMGNANRNASDLIDTLTLELNSLRQAAITQEIAEITGGAEAIAV